MAMFDTELYQQVLGLSSPWRVADVRLDMESTQIHIHVEHSDGCRWSCPQCGCELSCYDHAPEREWRHLDTCQFMTLVHARIPRVKCPEHGVVQVKVPWAEPHGRFTILMERFVINVLQACQTVKGACELVRISWDQAWHVLERAVTRGLSRKEATTIARIGVDEKAFRKGHRYLTIVNDVENGTVEFVSEGREKASLATFFESRTPEQLAGIEAIAMDMWEPYLQATLEAVPLASSKIVFDRFHIMQHMTKSVDAVRRAENRALSADGDDRLKRTKYLWIASKENVHPKRRAEFRSLRGSDLKTARAWAIKENLRHLWDFSVEGWARRFFSEWSGWAMRSRLEPVKAVARMIGHRLENVITYCRHRITNGVAEGLNSKIMAIKRRAGGYRNVLNFKTVIYFYCGGLQLYP
jgi:transposase